MDNSTEVLPWVRLVERVQYDGYRRIVRRVYRLPSGEESHWDIVDGERSVSVIAVTDDHRVVLVRQFRPGPEKVLLELPGGIVDLSESVEDAAARELLEETGYKANSIELISSTWLAGFSTYHRYTAVARGCYRVAEPTPDVEEFLEPVELSMSDFMAHALSGDLTDQDHALRGLVALRILAPTI